MQANSAFLYAVTVLIWGSTWIAIKYQVETVPPEQSIAYRFALAALVLLVYCRARGLELRFGARQHARLALQGLLLFSCNYIFVYVAAGRITSGLIAVVFSALVFMNIFNAALIFRQPVQPRVVAGAAMGLGGIVLLFLPEIEGFDFSGDAMLGLGLSLAGTYVASLGTMVSVHNQRAGLPVMQSNAYGMAYGALVMLGFTLALGHGLAFDPAPRYVLSLLYLAIPGSVIAFWCFLTLLTRIGPDRAAYATVLFPVVALVISTVAEDYRWSPPAALGVALVLLGNLVILERGWLRRLTASAAQP